MIVNAIGIGRNKVDLEQFRMGQSVEQEHGSRDPQINVTGDDMIATGRIALAHLKELPDYYTRLALMESGADIHAKDGYHMPGPPELVRTFQDQPRGYTYPAHRRYSGIGTVANSASLLGVRDLSFWAGTIAGTGLVLLVRWALARNC